jgi:hypothetical protein
MNFTRNSSSDARIQAWALRTTPQFPRRLLESPLTVSHPIAEQQRIQMSVEHYGRVPYLPEGTLRKHKVYEPADTRFRAAARLRQALFREENAWPIGSYRTKKGRCRKLGSYINTSAAQDGANFISPAIAKLVRREVAFREDGALYDEARLQSNLLSSHPATFNILGPMKLDIELATATFQALCPDLVSIATFRCSTASAPPSKPSLIAQPANIVSVNAQVRNLGPNKL